MLFTGPDGWILECLSENNIFAKKTWVPTYLVRLRELKHKINSYLPYLVTLMNMKKVRVGQPKYLQMGGTRKRGRIYKHYQYLVIFSRDWGVQFTQVSW